MTEIVDAWAELVSNWIDNFSVPIDFFTEATTQLAVVLLCCTPFAWWLGQRTFAVKLALQAIVLLAGAELVLEYANGAHGITFESSSMVIGVLIVDLLIVWNLISSVLDPIGIPVSEVTKFVLETIRDMFVATIRPMLEVFVRVLLLPLLRPFSLLPDWLVFPRVLKWLVEVLEKAKSGGAP